MNPFLPVSKKDMKERGWEQLDFVLVSADAYVDHPSFGAAIIARVLEDEGYRVAVLAQPDWHSADAFRSLGKPRYGVMIGGRKAFWRWGSRGWLLWCPAGTSIPWWPITQWPNAAAAKMSTVPAAKRGIVPTGLPSSIPSS